MLFQFLMCHFSKNFKYGRNSNGKKLSRIQCPVQCNLKVFHFITTDRHEMHSEYQTKEKEIILGMDLLCSHSVFIYIFSSFYAKYYFSFIQIIITISYDCLPIYVYSQHQQTKMKEII